uniref:Peroxisomal biogenesis factor 11 n=1 Tax=Tetraselmis sp. GSL018 TaxID=582737 RepID=A0A061RM03_9CHLO|mmetsp:Transcript_38572/g.91441  ORF Transcript_38572/g.91441 Transcript_38572/m.91441 type:complete len:226 (-) Transcript_38572:228-905(-)
MTTREHLETLTTFVSKYEAKDKLTGLLQYAAMFCADGKEGRAKTIQLKISNARRVFRVLNETNPLKALAGKPLIGKDPLPLELLEKIKLLSFAGYCVGNHLAFAGETGVIRDQKFVSKAHKLSLWGWCLSSLSTGLSEMYQIANLLTEKRTEGGDEHSTRSEAIRREIKSRLFNTAHALSMVVLALGLLQRLPIRARTLGALGVFASAVSCYKLYPALPSSRKVE